MYVTCCDLVKESILHPEILYQKVHYLFPQEISTFYLKFWYYRGELEYFSKQAYLQTRLSSRLAVPGAGHWHLNFSPKAT